MQRTYTILGDPVPLQRPRVIGGRFWNPQKHIRLQWSISLAGQHEDYPKFIGPLHLDVIFYMCMPIREKKKTKSNLLNTFHYKKPDLSNLIKFVEDSGTGILYYDDSLIASITAKKVYDTTARTIFTITELNDEKKYNASKRLLNDNTTTVSEKSTKTCKEWEQYLNTISFQLEPANEDFFKRLCIEMVIWARENPDGFMISQFYLMRGISSRTFYSWVEKYEDVAAAFDVAMDLITQRRERYLVEKDPSSVRYMMPQYSKQWLKEDNRRAQQRKEIKQDQPQNITVILPEFDESH